MNYDLLGKIDIEAELEKKSCDIHIRIQQRNGRKCISIVEGLNDLNLDDKHIQKLAKTFRKTFNCSAIVKDSGNVIQLQGDRRNDIKNFLIDNKLCEKDDIKIHGF